jgi:phospholipase A-2-activating protein
VEKRQVTLFLFIATLLTPPQVDYLGREYDYVFDVDIEDGKPALKLPYNLSQNPYEAATKFIQDNELPITYLDQVANFITANTQGATLGQSAQQPSGVGSDPWGSDNRYRPGEASTSSVAPRPKVIPQREFLSITVGRAPAIEKKIIELNQALIASGKKDLSLNSTELSILSDIRKHIESSSITKISQSVSYGLDLAVKLTTKWPYKDRLPGLDLLRLLAVSPQAATLSYRGGNIIDVFEVGSTEEQPPAENHVMMAFRGFTNLFETSDGRILAVKEFDKIRAMIATAIAKSTNRNLLVAVATVYINYAVLFKTESTTSFEHVIALLDTLAKILKSQTDSEVIYRALVATGTLLTLDAETTSAAKDVYEIEEAIATAVGKASDPRIRNAAAEISPLLK